jgi:hypothetical protein
LILIGNSVAWRWRRSSWVDNVAQSKAEAPGISPRPFRNV